MPRLTALALAVLLAAACAGSEEIVAQDVVSEIPWGPHENARYRLLQGDDVVGSGEISLAVRGNLAVFAQQFDIPGEEVTDTVSVTAHSETLRPSSVQRVIDGPKGARRCEARYGNGVAHIEQHAEKEERKDDLNVPEKSYDTWTDLFVWRTLPFAEGYEVKYAGVLSCSLAKPDLLSEVLKVKELETVSVPAGTFEAWRLEIRSGGRTQHAWYADDDARTLVRYDNGELVFELESID
jgi:hypothetical protein